MAKKWKAINKVAEECGELIKELMKLSSYPTGVHPRRRRRLELYVQEEAADVLASLTYFLERNRMDLEKVEHRKALKMRKWIDRWGDTPASAKAKRKGKKSGSKHRAKNAPKVKLPSSHVSLYDETSKTT